MSSLLTAPITMVDGDLTGPSRDRVTICKLCRFGIYPGGEPAVWLRNPMGRSHKACADRAGLTPVEPPPASVVKPAPMKNSQQGLLPEPNGRRSGSRDASPAARKGGTQEQARPQTPPSNTPALPPVPVPVAEQATTTLGEGLGEESAARLPTTGAAAGTTGRPPKPDGAWHYLLEGRVSHFRRELAIGIGPDLWTVLGQASVCGIGLVGLQRWMGDGTNAEIAFAKALRKCPRCVRIIQARRWS